MSCTWGPTSPFASADLLTAPFVAATGKRLAEFRSRPFSATGAWAPRDGILFVLDGGKAGPVPAPRGSLVIASRSGGAGAAAAVA